MAFGTYGQLQEEVLAKLNRANDGEAVLRCASWVTLAEDGLRMRFSRMKSRQGETRNSAYVISSEFTNLPDGFIRMRSAPVLQLTPTRVLEYAPPNSIDHWDKHNSNGIPSKYTVQGNQLRVNPPPDISYTAEIGFYTLPALSVTSPTNWLLTAHPRLYFKAVLTEAYDFYEDAANYDKTLLEVNAMIEEIDATDGAEVEGPRVRIRVSGATP